MSNQQKKQNKSATERLKDARLREEKAAKVRRRIVLGVSCVAVVALAAGVAIAVSDNGDSSAAASGPLVVPANTTGQDGTVITYGKADAPHTLKIYEDFRCPICERLETTDGKTIQQLADNGTYKIEYHIATFLDANLGGKGSRTALAAAGAALNEGVDKFKQFHDVLYANQPNEQTDGFGDVNHLLDLAGKVPGLKTDAFVKAVQDGTYAPWAAKVSKSFDASGVSGTPTLVLDGKQLNVFDGNGTPVTADQYQALVQQTVSAG
ncbi:thioredoxin domain-containing protein [Kitasatospora sp. GP82]|uniref:thioredoxin domain-containing protein n=1 Tax=Kitasatospora sp. GP82 TaxID=3035089 RepID=UPI002474825A|nr:thioredoxin domain-containing protein [Kitasatospora sp. GP82]MDH6123765.1 protein-disulfide isomerase [Kitasatospora sp. GP82]